MSLDTTHKDQAAADELYWRVVDETIREIFQGNGKIVANLRKAVLSRPWMERQAFYNTEPFDLAVDFLEVDPTDEQYDRYEELSARLVEEHEEGLQNYQPDAPQNSTEWNASHFKAALENSFRFGYPVEILGNGNMKVAIMSQDYTSNIHAKKLENSSEKFKMRARMRDIMEMHYGKTINNPTEYIINFPNQIFENKKKSAKSS